MRVGADDTRELFRFEYHPLKGDQRRIRILIDPAGSTLQYVAERETRDGWRITGAQEIEYFEYSDEESQTSPTNGDRDISL